MPNPSLVGVGRDLGRAFRERPALVVGAGVLGLIGISLLGRGRDTGDAGADGEAVEDPLAGLFPGVGTWGGSIPGSGSVPWAGYPSAGDGSYVEPGYYGDGGYYGAPAPSGPAPAYAPPSYTPAPAPGTSTPAPTPLSGEVVYSAPGVQSIGDWAAYQAEKLGLIAARAPDSPYAPVSRQLVDKYGGTIYPGQGPEENLTSKQYSELVLGQFAGNAPVLSSPNVAYSRQAWYDYLLRVGPAGYVGVNSGVRDDAEYYRNLAIAKVNAATERAGVAEGSVGYPSIAPTPPMPAPAPIVAPKPVVDNSARIQTLTTALATNARNIATIQAIPVAQRTASQSASLATNLATRDVMQRELASLTATRAF